MRPVGAQEEGGEEVGEGQVAQGLHAPVRPEDAPGQGCATAAAATATATAAPAAIQCLLPHVHVLQPPPSLPTATRSVRPQRPHAAQAVQQAVSAAAWQGPSLPPGPPPQQRPSHKGSEVPALAAVWVQALGASRAGCQQRQRQGVGQLPQGVVVPVHCAVVQGAAGSAQAQHQLQQLWVPQAAAAAAATAASCCCAGCSQQHSCWRGCCWVPVGPRAGVHLPLPASAVALGQGGLLPLPSALGAARVREALQVQVAQGRGGNLGGAEEVVQAARCSGAVLCGCSCSEEEGVRAAGSSQAPRLCWHASVLVIPGRCAAPVRQVRELLHLPGQAAQGIHEVRAQAAHHLQAAGLHPVSSNVAQLQRSGVSRRVRVCVEQG